jgi:thiamine phosphate synthase YjbQ (UPF0047 family)
MKTMEINLHVGSRRGVTDITREVAQFVCDEGDGLVNVLDGRLALGTWQSIVLVDPNGDNPDRRIRLSFVSG